MEKIRLGKTNLKVSRIGFGGIPIQTPPEEKAVKIVKNCLDLGINFFDTSRVYTNSEERIGKALSCHREEAIIATKTVSRTAEKMSEEKKLRQSIIENLQMVLRTRQGSVLHLPDFGMPDILQLYFNSGNSL